MSELFQRPSSPRRRSTRRSFDEREPKSGGDGGLFGWAIFILLLIGLVAVCWMGTIYIFGHPETPMGYSVLHKFKKIEAPKRFSEFTAPKGEFLDAKKLLDRYNPMSDHDLKKESDRLLRDYIRNYSVPDGPVPYITGRYTILDSYELTKNDFFPSGVVALAQDSETPQILVESAFTADERAVPALYRSLLTGLQITLHRSSDISPIIHIERLADGRLKFTTVPLQYPNYSSTQGPGSFSLEPPAELNVEAGLPVLSNAKVIDADRHFATYRNKLAKPADGKEPAPAMSALMPVRPATATDGTTPAPAPAAVPVPESTPPPVVSATPAVAAPPAVAPRVMPAIPVNGTPAQAAATPATVGADVTLKPFMEGSQPAAVSSTTSGRWQTYKPGQMPRGKLVDVNDARTLSAADLGTSPTYLEGDFTVTAAVGNSAVLRRSANDPTRIVVQYPAGDRTPAQGQSVSRKSDRPFLVTSVRKAPDGTVNIYVREVVSDE